MTGTLLLPGGRTLPLARGPRIGGAAILAGAVMLVVFGGFGGWAAVAELDSAAVAPATVTVESHRKTVQLLEPGIVKWEWLAGAVALGFVIGVPLSRVPLTAVPQRTALSHAFGGLAAGLVGTAKYYLWLHESPESLTAFRMVAIVLEVILGYLTFTGSLMAAGKLQEVKFIPQRPVTYPLQNASNLGLLGIAIACGVLLVVKPTGLTGIKGFE